MQFERAGYHGLVASGVSAFRGERLVLRDVSLDVPPGGALLLLGANGSGKSTLLRLLAGLKRPDAGAVELGGSVAYLGHQDAIKPGLTVRENLRFPPADPAALDALGLAALANIPARMLSAGQKRRLALARVIGRGAAVWLLDEPTLGLDAASVAALGTLLARHRAAGGTVVAATHLDLPLPDAAVLDLTPTPAPPPTSWPGSTRPSTGSEPNGVRPEDSSPRHDLSQPHAVDGRIKSGDDVRWREGGGGPVALFLALLRRELLLSVRHGADTLAAVLFFVLAAALFPLAIGPAPETLARLAPGIVWVGALLAALLPLDRLFGADHEDGSLDQLMLSGLPPSGVAAAKAVAHWLGTGLPLLLAAGPVALMLQMPAPLVPVLLAGLLPGTAALSLLGTLGAAVVVGARRGGVLLPLLVLPLATPVLIFGAAAVEAAASGLGPRPHLLLLCAVLAAALPLCPLAAGGALRIASE